MIEPQNTAATIQMVAAMPRIGAVIFVADKQDGCFVRDLVLAWHGNDTLASTHILVAPTTADEALLMRGRPYDLQILREPTMLAAREKAEEPLVPRRAAPPEADDPTRCAKCGTQGPGWCTGMLCPRRPLRVERHTYVIGELSRTKETLHYEPEPVRQAEPPEPKTSMVPGMVDLFLYLRDFGGFTYTEVLGMDAETKRAFVHALAPDNFDVISLLRRAGLLST